MSTRHIALTILSFITISLLFVSAIPVNVFAESDTSIELLRAEADLCSFHYTTGTVTAESVTINRQHFATYYFPGGINRQQIGQSTLPYDEVRIAVPVNASGFTISYHTLNTATRSGFPPAPAPVYEKQADGTVLETWPETQLKSIPPKKPFVEITEPEFFRFQRFVTVRIHPLHHNGLDELSMINEAEITVRWTESRPEPIYRPAPADPFGEKMYNAMFINAERAANWRIRAERNETDIIFSHSANWVRIGISDDYLNDEKRYRDKNSIYRLTAADLNAAGVNLSQVDLSSVRLFSNGSQHLPINTFDERKRYQEIPIVTSQSSGPFSDQDYLLFFGVAQTGFSDEFNPAEARQFYENPYAATNYYWLTWGGSFANPPRRIVTEVPASFSGLSPETSFRHTIHFEDNLDWVENEHLNDDDWIWDFLVGRTTIGGDNYYYPLKVINPAAASPLVDITVGLKRDGATGDVRFYLNDMQFGSHLWTQGGAIYSETFEAVSASSSDNELTIQMNATSTTIPDQAYLGWYYVEYDRNFNAVDNRLKFRAPQRSFGGGMYTVTGFSTSDIIAWDITNHLEPRALPISTGSSGGSYTATWQDTVSTGDSSQYIVADSNGYLPVDSVERVNFPVQLLHDVSGAADYLILAPAMYHDELTPLVQRRQASLISAMGDTPGLMDDPVVQLVDSEQIYNEFSGGYLDPAGVRDFLKYTFDHWQRAPLYVLFVSDANIDFRNFRRIENPIINYIPTRQYQGSSEWATDDWLVWLDSDRQPDMVNGRFPVANEAELAIVVQKVLDYELNPELGRWRNRVTAVADDYKQPSSFSPNQIDFTTTEDEVNREHVPAHFDLTEIFMVEYDFDPGGTTKIAAHNDFLEAINDGSVMVRYTGHGGPPKMADENIFNILDIPTLNNGRRLALWGSFSCDVAYFDHYTKDCIAEAIFVAEDKGAIGFIAGIRSTYASPNQALELRLVEEVFQDEPISMGEALVLAKASVGNETNSSKYVLFGDPAQQLARPAGTVVFDNIDIQVEQADTVTISGAIHHSTGLNDGFNGTAYITLFSNREVVHFVDSDHNVDETWDHHGTPIFRGTTPVSNGRFSQTVFIPGNVQLGEEARVSVYAWDEALNTDAAGAIDTIKVVTGTTDIQDDGPNIQVFVDDNLLLQSGLMYPHSTLRVVLFDEQGINLAGTSEAGVLFDMIKPRSDSSQPVETVFQADLTPYFEYDLGEYQRGSLEWTIPDLEEGNYVLRIRAIDNLNNANMAAYNITIRQESVTSSLAVLEAFNYPNPTAGHTDFLFKINHFNSEATIKIYTVAGRLIKTLGPVFSEPFPAQNRISWDGRDEDGDQLANGVYLYQIKAVALDAGDYRSDTFLGKLVIHR